MCYFKLIVNYTVSCTIMSHVRYEPYRKKSINKVKYYISPGIIINSFSFELHHAIRKNVGVTKLVNFSKNSFDIRASSAIGRRNLKNIHSLSFNSYYGETTGFSLLRFFRHITHAITYVLFVDNS